MLAGLRPAPPGLKRFKSFAHSLNLRQDDSQDDFQLHSDNSPFCLDMIEFLNAMYFIIIMDKKPNRIQTS